MTHPDTLAPTPMDQLAESIAQIDQHFQQWARDQGIPFTTLAVLHTISQHGHCTQAQVCKTWLLPKQTVSSICRQLLTQGHVQLDQGSTDRREKTLSFTPAGAQWARPIVAALEQLEHRVFARMGEADSQQLLTLLLRFNRLLAEAVDEDRQAGKQTVPQTPARP